MALLSSIKSRRSVRAFLDKPVPMAMIESLLEAARWAASDKNSQPWRVMVLTGQSKAQLSSVLVQACQEGVPQQRDYALASEQELNPLYKARAQACGYAMYSALNIQRDDMEKRQLQWEQNFKFFNAPVAFIFYVDKKLKQNAWMDMGMFLQNIMLGAQEFGLASCAQNSIAGYAALVRKTLNISEDFHIVCGLSLGFPDYTKPINQYRTERASVDEFTTWLS